PGKTDSQTDRRRAAPQWPGLGLRRGPASHGPEISDLRADQGLLWAADFAPRLRVRRARLGFLCRAEKAPLGELEHWFGGVGSVRVQQLLDFWQFRSNKPDPGRG